MDVTSVKNWKQHIPIFFGLILSVIAPWDAAQAVIVTEGQARFDILTPTLIRMEYAANGAFDNGTTFNVINKSFPAPSYTTQVVGGWREIQTANLLVRYQQNSGAFGPNNLTAQLTVNGQTVVARPFPGCPFGKLCQAEDATLSGSAAVADDHVSYTGKGFVAGYNTVGARATWSAESAPAGNVTFTARYANSTGGDGQNVARTLSLYVNGVRTQISLPTTANWDTWGNFQRTVTLNAGRNTIALACDTGDTCNVNLDSVSLTTIGAALPGPDVSTNLGAWRRALDGVSDTVPLYDGLLDKRGWYLLDDARTVLWTPGGSPVQRSAHGGTYQDGYFFGYAYDFQRGLRELAQLTGPAPLLPRSAFGNWFSRYTAYSAADYQSLVNTFRSSRLPLDVLVVDTDFKAPDAWSGWNWNTSLFPDPTGFMNWAKQNGLAVTLNIHPAIRDNDPKFATANSTAGGLIGPGPLYFFDWSNSNHLRAYLDLHTSFNNQGVDFWWLDWCCDISRSSMSGLTPDAWINYQYAKNTSDRGKRGFAFSRMGSQHGAVGPGQSGPWAEHRNTAHFTGDTMGTWGALKVAAKVTIGDGNIGIPYVSHDLGTHNGGVLADDFYMRWIQFGTFEPIFRPHSNHAPRWPWEYPNVRAQAEKFWRLRGALVPYTYSLAREASQTGLPMVRGLYLYHPTYNEAYTFDTERYLGSHMLVAPVITAGANASTSVWFPPGTWTDYFTGQSFSGPAAASISSSYDSYPVFVKAGGIIPLAPYMDYANQRAVDPLTLRVFAGADGSFSLYEDAGDGLGYQTGANRTTAFTFSNSARTLTIGTAQGTYPGSPTQRGYEVEFNNVTQPSQVTVNGAVLAQVPAGSGQGWWYASSRLTVRLNARAISAATTISYAPVVGVYFYQNSDFGGTVSGAKAKGDYSVLPGDVPNDWMSSLRVPSGWIVDAYENGGFLGAVCTFTADTSWVGTDCNDKMSSFRVR